MDIISFIIVVNVVSFLISIIIDYILFRIWIYLYEGRERYRSSKTYRWDKKPKKKSLDKELIKRGFKDLVDKNEGKERK